MLVVVGRPDDAFLDREAALFESHGEVVGIAKDDGHADLTSFPFVDVDRAVSRMNGDHGNTTGLKCPLPVGEDMVEWFGWSVDEAVERDDAADAAGTDGKPCKIGDHDLAVSVEDASLPDLADRRVGRDDLRAACREEAAHVCGSCSDLEERLTTGHAVGDPAEQRPVERLAVEFVGELSPVEISDAVERSRDAPRLTAPVLLHALRRYAPYPADRGGFPVNRSGSASRG